MGTLFLDLHLFVPLSTELRAKLESFALTESAIDQAYGHLLHILNLWNPGSPERAFLLKMPFHFM